MPLRVAYDYDTFTNQRYGGISRSFVEIFHQFESGGEVEPVLPFFLSRNAYLRHCSCYSGITIDTYFRGLSRILKAMNALTFVPALYGRDIDVYHQTFYNEALVHLRPDIPFVVTVHDMTPELYPEHFENPGAVHPGKQRACEHATAVICVSENTKQDLQRVYELDSTKLHVVHHGGGEKRIEGKESLDTPDRYVLYVGKRRGYKNFSELAQAIIPLMEKMPELHLICAGGDQFESEELQLFEEKRMGSRIHHDSPSDEKMASYYQNAELLVFPSLYEGFGLPILEAFRNRCPVVASRRSCFPEIAGEAAAYFEPGEDGALATAIERVLKDDTYRRELVKSGLRRAKKFTWQRSADRLHRVYQHVVRRGL